MAPPSSPVPEDDLDLTLLEGFRFECRPDCGLCCFAEPAADAAEQAHLLQIEPALEWVPEETGFARLASRPGGGACPLLRDDRCRAHEARPYPCRVFPVHVHIGERVQGSLVLSCPGLELSALASTGVVPRAGPPGGLEAELRAVQEECRRSPLGALRADAARRLDRALRRERFTRDDLDAMRRVDVGRLPEPNLGYREEFAAPGEESAPEERPLFWEAGVGILLLGSREGGSYVLSRADPAGGPLTPQGEFPLPARAPGLSDSAARLLTGYLRYLTCRDHFLWSILESRRARRWDPLAEEFESSLSAVRAELLDRASVRARFAGRTGDRLDEEDLRRGIRSIDSDLLDRPTLGSIL